jgi:hypothetical protein
MQRLRKSQYNNLQEKTMKRGVIKTVLGACLLALAATPAFATDLTADQALTKLKEGNERFVSGKSMHPHTDAARLIQAGKEDQGNHHHFLLRLQSAG